MIRALKAWGYEVCQRKAMDGSGLTLEAMPAHLAVDTMPLQLAQILRLYALQANCGLDEVRTVNALRSNTF